ncbi:hypothetical protein HMPREF9682_00489 [Streptococcus intermedius F0395]|uniref:hypothetical protein n=1 Tax=Streptococcus constellatus TaxID=76860 RepID=UPI0002329592|nr:hypothetical protein [Streptococcus constellatus]EHG14452.1 hypothetical protein HMPREF9682_00489 [Streptococcus intermedius F0395]
MTRKNYFELIQDMEFNADKEFEIISILISKSNRTDSVGNVFNRNFWLYENYRKIQFKSYDDVKNYFENNFSGNNRLFAYTEFIIDLNSFLRSSEISFFDKITLTEQFPKIKERIDYFLAKTNHELKKLEDGRQIIIEKNVYASEVSQIVSETNIQEAMKILEYNHFSNKGNTKRKEEILFSLAKYLEPLEKELNASEELKEVMKVNNKKIIAVDKLFEMYNKLDVRHPERQYNDGCSDEELEQWYDDIYTSTLFVILSLDEARILSRFNKLKLSNQK